MRLSHVQKFSKKNFSQEIQHFLTEVMSEMEAVKLHHCTAMIAVVEMPQRSMKVKKR